MAVERTGVLPRTRISSAASAEHLRSVQIAHILIFLRCFIYLSVCSSACLSVCLSVKVLKTVPQMCFRRLNVLFLVRAKSFVLEHERASPRTDISAARGQGGRVDTAELNEIRAGFSHHEFIFTRNLFLQYYHHRTRHLDWKGAIRGLLARVYARALFFSHPRAV